MGDGQDVSLWPIYDAIRCPTLVVRGAKSDLLTAETGRQMTERGPRARLVEIPEVGHAPALLDEAQLAGKSPEEARAALSRFAEANPHDVVGRLLLGRMDALGHPPVGWDGVYEHATK